jgi:hypothetical protein
MTLHCRPLVVAVPLNSSQSLEEQNQVFEEQNQGIQNGFLKKTEEEAT